MADEKLQNFIIKLENLLKQKKWEELLEQAKRFMKKYPDNADGYFYAGYAGYHFEAETLDWQSENFFKHVVELDPNHKISGLILEANQTDREERIKSLDKLVKVLPDFYLLYGKRGATKLSLGKLEEAEADLETAMGAFDGCGPIYSSLAETKWKLNKTDEALELLSKAISKFDGIHFQNRRGEYYRELGRIPAAKSDFKSVINKRPDYGVALNNLGQILMSEGLFEDAYELFSKAHESNPNDKDYLLNKTEASRRVELAIFEKKTIEAHKESLLYISNPKDIIAIYKNEIQFSYVRLFGDDSNEVKYWDEVFINDDEDDTAHASNESEQQRDNIFCQSMKWLWHTIFKKRKKYLNLNAANASSRLRWSVIAIVLFVSAVFYAMHKETNSWAIGEIGFQHIFQYTTVIAILAAPFFLHTRQIIRRSEEERTIAHSLTRDMISLLFWSAQEPDDRSSNRAKLANAMLHHMGTNSTADVSLRMMGRRRSGADEGRGDDGRLSFMESTLQDIKSQLDVIKGQQKGGD